MRIRVNLSLAVSLLALVVALGGTSYAAATLAKHSVGRQQLQKNAVTSAKVKDASLVAADFASGQLPAGAKGDRGPAGPPGAPATVLYASVESTGQLLRGSRAVSSSRLDVGLYAVTFDRDVTGCVPLASVGSDAGLGGAAPLSTSIYQGGAAVRAYSSTGQPADRSFYVAVLC